MFQPHITAPRRSMPRRAALALQVASLGTVAMCASAPTPLYRVYQEHWQLSPAMVTVIFSVYAISLLVALLTVGKLSDHIGRRTVMSAGLLINLVAMALFAVADSVATLLIARTIQGFATGMAFSTIGAAMLDTDRKHGSLLNSLTPVTGTGLGSIVSGVLVSYAPLPTQLIYLILVAVLLITAVLVWWMPETVIRRPGALASLKPTVVVPPEARQPLISVSPGNVAVWALGGFYMSLMPSLLRQMTGSDSPLLGGLAVTVLTFSGALSMLVARTWAATTILICSMSCLIVGVVVTLCGVYAQSVALLMFGTMITGIGFGSGFFGSIRTVVPLAPVHARAGLLSVIFIVCYLAFSLPTIVAGLAIPRIGLALTLDIYGAATIVLAAVSLVATLIARRRAA